MAFILVFVAGLFIGMSYPRLQEYARSAPIGIQGKELLKEIHNFKTKTGQYPDQVWFSNLGNRIITDENRIWTYHNPPIKSSGDNYILISVPVDRGNAYLYGYSEGYIQAGSYSKLNISEQVDAANPTPR